MPPGLSFNTVTGVVAGIPTPAGTFTFTVTATDANGCTGLRQYTLTVAGTCAGLTISPVSVNFPANGGKM